MLEHQKDHQNIRKLSLHQRRLTDSPAWKASRLKLEQWGSNQLWVKILTRNQSCFLQVVLRPNSSASEEGFCFGTAGRLCNLRHPHRIEALPPSPRHQIWLSTMCYFGKCSFGDDSPWRHCQTFGFHGPVISNPTRLGHPQRVVKFDIGK